MALNNLQWLICHKAKPNQSTLRQSSKIKASLPDAAYCHTQGTLFLGWILPLNRGYSLHLLSHIDWMEMKIFFNLIPIYAECIHFRTLVKNLWQRGQLYLLIGNFFFFAFFSSPSPFFLQLFFIFSSSFSHLFFSFTF